MWLFAYTKMSPGMYTTNNVGNWAPKSETCFLQRGKILFFIIMNLVLDILLRINMNNALVLSSTNECIYLVNKTS